MACNCSSKSSVLTPSKVVHGAIGLVKAAVGIGLASSAVISQRRDICAGCDKNISGICSECKCIIMAKTSLNNEVCPLQLWPK